MTLDRNYDGAWDFRGLLLRGEIFLSPREFWDDEDLDGRVEIHAVLTGSPDHPSGVGG